MTMLLAVDVGNTQTVIGLYAEQELVAHWRVATVLGDTADELLVQLNGLLALHAHRSTEISAGAIASVVPVLTEQWQQVLGRLCRREPLVLDSNTDSGLLIDYPNPAEIGADRIADAVGAIALYGAPVIVVDFGTATNIEVIDERGAFIGGIITPGLATSANALFAAAARLAKVDVSVPAKAIGRDTKTAVQSGLTYGEIDRIDGLVRRIFAELGYRPTVVATGGLSGLVIDLSETIDQRNDDLTLEGLRLIHNRLN
jgi:type III pantothenate kinase